MKILLIENPVAGRQKAGRYLDGLLSLFRRCDAEITHCATHARGDGTRIVREAEGTYDSIACMGGDGTLHEVVDGALAHPEPPPIGFIPCGTTNDLASSLGLPEDPMAAARLILAGHSQPMDVGRLNDRHFVYIASFGTFSDVVFMTPQSRKRRLGKFAYILTGALMLRRIKARQATITHDEGTEHGEYALLAITNAHRAGGGFIRYSQQEAALDDGLFEVLIVQKPPHFMHMLGVLAKMVLRRPDPRYIRKVRTSHARIVSDAPIPWCVDGEEGGHWDDVEIEVLARKIRVMRPPARSAQG